MNTPINGDTAIPPIIGNSSEVDISQAIISKLNDSQNTIVESKKQKKPVDTSYIYDYITKFEIEDAVISNLQKLQEKELINVPFFQKLRKIFNPQMIKSKLMKGLGIRESYTGFHEFMKGDRADLPNVGICKIAKTIGYDVMILPIPENITKREMDRLNAYRESFLQAIEDKIHELNIPITRTRSKDKDKPKEINKEFINNLAKTEEEFLAELNINKKNSSNIAIDDIFDDGQGSVEVEQKPFVFKKETKDYNMEPNINLVPDKFISQPLSFDPEEFNNEFDEDIFILNEFNNDSFGIDMMGYDDSLSNLRKIDAVVESTTGK